jgi:hypothetical protein
MGKWRLRFQFNPGTLLYLQTNADWYGNILSSSVLSCDFSKEEGIDRMGKMARLLEKKKTDKPVRWKDVIDRRQLFDENYDEEQAGDLIRDNCKEIRSVELNGGFLFGGPDGTKYAHPPTLVISSPGDPATKWTRPAITMLCKFVNKHDCKIELHKDSAERIGQMQDIMKNVFLREEIKKWNDHPSKKAKEILDKTVELSGKK